MKRVLITCLLAVAAVGIAPAPAAADLTAFFGASPTPTTRSVRGFGLGFSLVVVGFEFEYANTAEDPLTVAPGLKTGMVNGLIQTPTRTQLYVTGGGGFFQERLGATTETSFGTNIGGGVKVGLVGPLRLRLDYRIFNLHGQPKYKAPQRFYAGVNLSF